MTSPGDVTMRYDSTDSGLLRQVIDAEGRPIVTNTYDAKRRVTHQD